MLLLHGLTDCSRRQIFPRPCVCWLPAQLPTAGAKVLDLGCVPGAWMQVACQQIGPHDRGGLVLGIDIQEVRYLPQRLSRPRSGLWSGLSSASQACASAWSCT